MGGWCSGGDCRGRLAGWLAIAGALQQADVLYREGGVRDGRREVVAGVLRQLQGRRLLGGRVG